MPLLQHKLCQAAAVLCPLRSDPPLRRTFPNLTAVSAVLSLLSSRVCRWLGEVLAVEELRHSKALRDFLGMPDCSMGPPSALRSTSLEGRGGVPGAFVSGLTHFPFLHTAHHCADRRDSSNRGFWRAMTSPSSALPRRRAATQPDLPPDMRSLNVRAHRRAVSVDSGAKGVEFGRAGGGSNAAVSEEEGVEGLRLALYGNQGGASVVQRGALCSIM